VFGDEWKRKIAMTHFWTRAICNASSIFISHQNSSQKISVRIGGVGSDHLYISFHKGIVKKMIDEAGVVGEEHQQRRVPTTRASAAW
jgi:hypothetical protein